MLYLILVAVAVIIGYLGYRRGPVPIFVASVVGMAASMSITDILVAGILRLYIFRPHFAATASQDNPLGFFLADFVALPLLYTGATLLFPHRRVLVGFGLTGLLAAVEYGFTRAGVFVHHGWSIWYSIPLFTVRFLVAAWWIPMLERAGYTAAFRAFLTWLSTHSVWTLWMIWISSILRVWVIRPGVLASPDSDRVLGVSLYHGLPFLVIGGLAVWLGWGRTVRGWLLTGALLIAYLLWLDASGMWRRPGSWGPLAEGMVLTTLAVSVSYLDRWFAAHLPAQARVR